MVTLTFLGATGTVTGSKYLLDTGRHRILIDDGLFQGPRKHRRRNWDPLPVEPSSIHAVVATHGHVDHAYGLKAFVTKDQAEPAVVAHRATLARFER